MTTVFLGYLAASFYSDYKCFYIYIDSENIFEEIPELPDKDFERERKDIINYCFSIDLK